MIKVHHNQVTVENLVESIKFYEKLGMKLDGAVEQTIKQEGELKNAKMKIAFLKGGNDTLELIEYINPKTNRRNDLKPWDIGAQHVSFEVQDVRELYNKLKNNVYFFSPPVDFQNDGIDVTWIYFKDPNGALIELIELH